MSDKSGGSGRRVKTFKIGYVRPTNPTPHNALADAGEEAETLAWLLNHPRESRDLRGSVGDGNHRAP